MELPCAIHAKKKNIKDLLSSMTLEIVLWSTNR